MGDLFRLMPPDEQQRLIAAIVGSVSTVPVVIQNKMVEHFAGADPAYGGGIAKQCRRADICVCTAVSLLS